MEALYTTGQVLKLTKLTGTTFGNWCQEPVDGDKDGPIVKAVQDVKGTGNHRSFSLTQVVGICVAAKLRNSDRGCHTKFVRKVVAAFGKITETQLQNRIRQHGKYFITFLQDSFKYPLLGEQADDKSRVDVQEIYNAVKKLQQ